jgi:regulatory protein
MFKNSDKAPKTYTPGEALPKIAAYCAYQERTQPVKSSFG